MFRVELAKEPLGDVQHWNISLAMSKGDCDRLIERTVPLAVLVSFAFAALTASRRLRWNGGRGGRFATLVRASACLLCMGLASIPLQTLTPGTRFLGSGRFERAWHSTRAYRIFSGYGLFRRMTGVGHSSTDVAGTEAGWGWAGLPPSVVARPEIILEAIHREDNSTSPRWRELKFRWKPGDVMKRPRQVAPHMPR